MSKRVERTRDTVLDRYTDSRLNPLTAQQLTAVRDRFPKIPDHLLDFYQTFGCGSIGDSMYMIYALISPTDIWDPQTAAELDGIFLIGDDFAGTHEAYHVGRGWEFGSVSPSGRYDAHTKYESFIDFIEDWYCKD